MSKEQTAVDWLFLMLNNPNTNQDFAKKLYDKAKEIEKEQTILNYEMGYINGALKKNINGEEYYNQTYTNQIP